MAVDSEAMGSNHLLRVGPKISQSCKNSPGGTQDRLFRLNGLLLRSFFASRHFGREQFDVAWTLFYFVCVGAVGAFNLLNSLLAGAA
jgi:hypothetical protein